MVSIARCATAVGDRNYSSHPGVADRRGGYLRANKIYEVKVLVVYLTGKIGHRTLLCGESSLLGKP